MISYKEAVDHAKSLGDEAVLWFKYVGSRMGWWLLGRSHDLSGTSYYGHKAISEETAKKLCVNNKVHSMFEPPGDAYHEKFRQPDGSFANKEYM